MLLTTVTAVAVDISIPVLVEVAEYFSQNKGHSQRIIIAFLMGYGVSMLPYGLLSDRYGRLPITYIGITIYSIAGVLSALSNSFDMLLCMRFFQGLGGGVGPVNARAIARDMYSGKQLSRMMSSIVAALGIAPILSPILGNFLNNSFGWRSVLLFPPFLGVLVIIGLLLTAYETKKQEQNLVTARIKLVKSFKIFWASKQSIWALFIITIAFSGYQIIQVSASLLMSEIYKIPTKYIGYIFGPTAGIMTLMTLYNRKKVRTKSSFQLLQYGIICSFISAIGLLICSFSTSSVPFAILWAFFVLYIAGIGFIFSNTSSIALEPLSAIAGLASSLYGTIMILGASIATSVASSYYDKSITSISYGIIFCGFTTILIYALGKLLLKQSNPKTY